MRTSKPLNNALRVAISVSLLSSPMAFTTVAHASTPSALPQLQQVQDLKRQEQVLQGLLEKGAVKQVDGQEQYVQLSAEDKAKAQQQLQQVQTQQGVLMQQLMDQAPIVISESENSKAQKAKLSFEQRLILKYDISEKEVKAAARKAQTPLTDSEIADLFSGKSLGAQQNQVFTAVLKDLAFDRKQESRDRKNKNGKSVMVLVGKSGSGTKLKERGTMAQLAQFFQREKGQKTIQVGKNLKNPENSAQMVKRAPFEMNDLAENLVDNSDSMLRTLESMESKRSARLPSMPWSDSYWPIYQGILGSRYGDSGFLAASTSEKGEFLKFKNYVLRNPADSVVRSGRTSLLSPSEKYAKLIGLPMNPMDPLTADQWQQGEDSRGRDGNVETWMGICHGWAPAAYMLPRPANTVSVTAADGSTIEFFPSDIKALGSYIFAHNSPDTRFIGGRCNTKEKDLRKDRSNGRIQDTDCFDTNPGTWHMAVVNQIGVSKRSFVIDATYDYEVWNHPVIGYSYSYFNPATGREVSSLAQATSPARGSGDRFSSTRASNASSIVGIKMKLEYGIETEPDQKRTDSDRNDATKTVEYLYDVELDSNGYIVGGEWYTNKHPDFLWTPEPGGRALLDSETSNRGIEGSWTLGSRIPDGLADFAQGAARNANVSGTVVEALIAFANGRSYSKRDGLPANYDGRGNPPAVNPPAVNPPAVNPPRVNPPVVNPPVVNPPASSDMRTVIVQVKERSGGSRNFDIAEGGASYMRSTVAAAVAGAESVSAACDVGINKVALSIKVPSNMSFSSIKSALERDGFEGVEVPRNDSNSGKKCFCEGSYGPLPGAHCN